jgi:hypothetical protein
MMSLIILGPREFAEVASCGHWDDTPVKNLQETFFPPDQQKLAQTVQTNPMIFDLGPPQQFCWQSVAEMMMAV